MHTTASDFSHLLKVLTDIGTALSAEKNHILLLESILMKAQEITHADGGTLYTCTDDQKLRFEILINKSLKLHLGGTSQNQNKLDDLPLYNEQGEANKNMLAPWAAISKKTIHIEDAYKDTRFKLSGTKQFDQQMNYHSQSFFVVPMTNHLNEVIGVLQLINAINPETKKISSFSKLSQQMVESLASQAAITITNQRLIQAQKELFDSLIQLIAKAIDEKSPYTGGHCRRVPIITRMIAEAACEVDYGPLKHFSMTEEEMYELEVAAWLHDCGKISIPEAVVDKATKLETIIDGIKWIDTRFEVLQRDAIIASLQAKIKKLTGTEFDLSQDNQLQEQLNILDQERDLIRKMNQGKEFTQDEDIEAMKKIAQRQWISSLGQKEDLLSETERQMLSIRRGTLSSQEREIINNHVKVTIKMLESLPYPKNLRNVPLYAGGHHEKLDGTGYPRGLTKEQLPIQARIIALADIFEALTASDRPYKKAIPLEEALEILNQMKIEGKIDPDLMNVFLSEKIYERYAREYL
ncbi:metal dependent phosphohydrolase [Legionella quinlivanii]|uniref:Metal dependent phosphohydrolase n=1 Tax=Legionella quinlivanii TaxID=45073 RepID=A0A0W0XLU4_9GAMM|nr:HD family phosphohydrolase [Legionella quinlivanii]KTD45459.1 metal dependent phosphohydrolase [Legionella quinlivanii]SEG33163.1 HD-GYP domain, c-di-GMP phosphodiesterase class II (or its inactivated variant) [Legionella quinlivanii DSM 21216]STY10550.1 metal dependent phosphohydrolase [Legionella quinlivanii]